MSKALIQWLAPKANLLSGKLKSSWLLSDLVRLHIRVNTNGSLFDWLVFPPVYCRMDYAKLTKIYSNSAAPRGNFVGHPGLILIVVTALCGNTVSLLRSRRSQLASDAIPERFSSSLPPLFASGRFATFLSSAHR